MTRINTNVSSLTAQKTLSRSNAGLRQSLTRLSTGLRINSGKDDPAGLIAAETLRSDIVSIERAITNTERADQMIATADSALGQAGSLLNDIRGLITESANDGALSPDQIAANQLQVDSALEAINRISQSTTFQGKKLLDGSLDFITSEGAGFDSVVDLQIQQANLGATGQVDVSVTVTAAATQALVSNTGIAAGTAATASTGDLTFADATTPAVQGNIDIALDSNAAPIQATLDTVLSGGAGHELNVAAVAGGAYDGVAGNAINVIFAEADLSGAGLNADASLVGSDLTITVDNSGGAGPVAVADILTDLAADTDVNADFSFSGLGDYVVLTETTGSQGNLGDTTAGVDADVHELTVTANAGSDYDGVAGNAIGVIFAEADLSATPGLNADATFDGTNITVTVNNSAGPGTIAVADILTDLAADADVADFTFGGGGDYVVATETTGAQGNVGDTIAGADSIANEDIITVTSDATGLDTNGIEVSVVADSATVAGTASASIVDGNVVVSVNDASATSIDTIVNAINNLDGYSATASSVGTTDGEFDGATETGPTTALAGGIDSAPTPAVAASVDLTFDSGGVVNVVAAETGVDANDLTVSISDSAGAVAAGEAQASVDVDGNVQVLVGTGATDATIAASIDHLDDFSASVTTAGAYAAETVEGTLAGGAAQEGGLGDDLVVEISGYKGSEVFQFKSGALVDDMVAAINLVSDATGIEATNNAGSLDLQSVGYGSKEHVSVDVISEGENGTFESGLTAARSEGTDIDAQINGVQANANGNSFSINTSTLDVSMTVTEGTANDANFSITGGGARFQIGPDVVSNQQVRLGIQSLNTARLGGASGRLYELASGGRAALDNDANAGADIIAEALNVVSSLRGRLGAFQKTTLETNAFTLEDTLESLTGAESSIRDADFAKETAELTRSQILVQSGISVLSVANSNPQNVLSLLR